MARRRMFSADITQDDNFLDMSLTAQALYFHLGIMADDDGFVSPNKVIRMVGANKDDLRILVAKNFVIPFKSGVVVITHWKENNYIQKDRYKPTLFKDEFLSLKCIHNVYKLDTQVRLGKVRLGKVRVTSDETSQGKLVSEIINLFQEVNPAYKRWFANTTQRKACQNLLETHGFQKVKEVISILPRTNVMPYVPQIQTPHQLEEKWSTLSSSLQKQKTTKTKIII